MQRKNNDIGAGNVLKNMRKNLRMSNIFVLSLSLSLSLSLNILIISILFCYNEVSHMGCLFWCI